MHKQQNGYKLLVTQKIWPCKSEIQHLSWKWGYALWSSNERKFKTLIANVIVCTNDRKRKGKESKYYPICDQVIPEEMIVPSPAKLYNKREILIIFHQDNMNSRLMVLDLL